MRGCVVSLVSHGSCIMGRGSVFVWVSGSWVTACDPLFTLLGSLVGRAKTTEPIDMRSGVDSRVPNEP